MVKKLFLFVCVTLISVSAYGVESTKVAESLQRASVNVKADRAQGSGTLIVRKIEGKDIAFVVTAHHVVDGLRVVKKVIKGGTEKMVVTYNDAAIVQERIENGSTVGETKLRCKVLCVSSVNDIAVLQVRWDGLYKEGVEFDLSGKIPALGTKLYHTGSPGGQEIGAGSITDGIVSAVGRMINMGEGEVAYDQVTCAGLPGSSGGCVARAEDGVYIGTLTLGLGGGHDSFHWIVPIRRTLTWAKEAGIEYIFNPAATPLTFKALEEIKIEGTDIKVEKTAAGADRPRDNDSLTALPASVRNMLWTPSPTPANRPRSILLDIIRQ